MEKTFAKRKINDFFDDHFVFTCYAFNNNNNNNNINNNNNNNNNNYLYLLIVVYNNRQQIIENYICGVYEARKCPIG